MRTPTGPRSAADRGARPRRQRGKREQMSDSVAAHLRMAIMSGTLRPGSFIRLDDTAAELGVSMMPVREALRTLRGEGLVKLEPNRGHVVAPFTRGDVDDLFWLQNAIAVTLVRSAAERLGDDEIDEMERLTDALAAAVQRGDAGEVAASEFAFHRVVNRAAGRVKLAWFLVHANSYIPAGIYATNREWGTFSVDNHRGLTAALRRRDVEEAVRLTTEQFTNGARMLTARLDELGLWPKGSGPERA